MDSLRLGLQAVVPLDMVATNRQARTNARVWQHALLSLIVEKQLTRKDIAEVIGVSIGTVSKVLTGMRQLPNAWTRPLSRMLGLTREELNQLWRKWPKLRKSHTTLTEQDLRASKVLRDLFAQRSVRQIDVARAIGAHQPEISRVLTGRLRMPHGWYAKIATFFGTTSDIFENG
jgi:plasmid maintenance system antidote protein VapI